MERLRAKVSTTAKTEFGKRWMEMVQVSYEREISADELRNITLNVAAHQRDNKILRRDRFVPKEGISWAFATDKDNPGISLGEFKTREAALTANQSDAAILDEMEEVERESGLDMSEHEQDWYNYVIGGGERPDDIETEEDDSDVPF